MIKKNIFLCLGVVILSLVLVSSLQRTYTSSSFTIDEGYEVVSNIFKASNLSPNTEVFLNGKSQGIVGEIKKLKEKDFISKYVWRWWRNRWEGKNTLEFSSPISNFSLSVILKSIDSDIDEGCNQDWQCPEGASCVNNACCDEEFPLSFSTVFTSSCPGSSITVVPNALCAKSVSSSVNADIYLGNTLVRSDCNISGDVGWGLDGVSQCEVPVGTPGLGSYPLRAVYTLDGKNYNQTIKSISIENTCNTDRCSHGGWRPSEYVAEFRFNPSEYIQQEGRYIVPKGATIKIDQINSFISRCSNSADSGSTPAAIVAWIYGEGHRVGVSDNQIFNKHCDIGTLERTSYIGPSSETKGIRPDDKGNKLCDIRWKRFGGSNSFDLVPLNEAGNYSIYIDEIRAVCDAPDFVCPDLFGNRKSGPCNIALMKDYTQADGWRELDLIKLNVVSPKIKLIRNVSAEQKTNGEIKMVLRLKNIGSGNAKIIGVLEGDFRLNESLSSSLLIKENEEKELVVILDPKNSTTETFTRALEDFSITNHNFRNYSHYEIDGNALFLIYSLDSIIKYDDAYGFDTITPQPIKSDEEVGIVFNFSSSDIFSIVLKDREFVHSCVGNKICEHVFGEDSNPCACMNHLESNKSRVDFKSTTSWDMPTSAGNLDFSWFISQSSSSEVKFHNGSGMAGANFSKNFPSPGNFKIKVKVTDLGNNEDSDQKNVIVAFNPDPEQPEEDFYYCQENNGETYWINQSGNVSDAMNDCRKNNSINRNFCCPQNYQCNSENRCVSISTNISKCIDYPDENSCNEDKYNVAIKGINSKLESLKCGDGIRVNPLTGCFESIDNCKCEWRNNQCEEDWKLFERCDSQPGKKGLCSYRTEKTVDNCGEFGGGFYEIKLIANWTSPDNLPAPPECVDKTGMIPCPLQTMLPFTSLFGIVFALGMILTFYLMFSKKEMSKKKI
jgi:hypothetical protein